MRYTKLVKTDAELIDPKLDSFSVYLSIESNILKYFGNTKYILKLSATGEGQLLINSAYVNADGFTCAYGAFVRNSDVDTVIDNVTYYAFEQGGNNMYLKQNFEDKSAGDVIENVGYYMIEDGTITYDSETEGEMLILTITKYDPLNSGVHEEIINYSAGDNQDIEIHQKIIDIRGYDTNNNLTEIELPETVIQLNDEAFADCSSLIKVILPNSLLDMGYTTFAGCTNLQYIKIPVSVTSIPEQAFDGCTNLAQLDYTGTTEQWNALSKGERWNRDVPTTAVVTCTNGVIYVHS